MALVIPRSLVSGETAAARRAIAGILADNGAPVTGTDKGFRTGSGEFLHITAKATTQTFDLTLYVLDDISGEWGIATWFGTAGTLAIPLGTTIVEPVPLRGLPAVYFHVDNFGISAVADVWASVSSFD